MACTMEIPMLATGKESFGRLLRNRNHLSGRKWPSALLLSNWGQPAHCSDKQHIKTQHTTCYTRVAATKVLFEKTVLFIQHNLFAPLIFNPFVCTLCDVSPYDIAMYTYDCDNDPCSNRYTNQSNNSNTTNTTNS